MLEHKRICFDLDNTLVTYPEKEKDYTTCRPIEHNINFLRYLKTLGNTIIIHTARRMKTHGGNVGALLKDIGKITFDTLEKFQIPYDEIYFGKPYADFYIDDKAISAFSDLEKELGYYNLKIDEREFNNISKVNSIEILKKESKNLEGEIYYYKNLPNEIKDIFPFFFNYDVNNTWFEMEKIIGIAISNLYLKEELTLSLLESILGTINRIHKAKSYENFDINIYDNYSKKIHKRYTEYDYSKFPNSEEYYNKLNEKLQKYENDKMGIIGVIHGDPVFSNILINNLAKIKFIDIRGKIGDKLTNRGDIIYDYAKIYQSLVGYDEILLEKNISIDYKIKLISYFKKHFVDLFGDKYWEYLQYITASLLFSLIPLHNNNKCKKYYELMIKLL